MQRSYGAAAWALLRRRGSHILFIGAGSLVIDFLRVWPQVPDGADVMPWLLWEFPGTEFGNAALVVAAVTLGQAARVEGWKRFALMCAAGFVAVAIGGVWRAFMHEYFDWDFIVRLNIVTSLASHLTTIAWTWCAITVGLTLFYLTQEREALLARRAREVELERVEAQRTVMASRLDVLRARVEPEFLFGALADVRGLYGKDRAVAEAMVDALITYLRAALPQMRGQGSTLGREVELAAAYAAVLQVPRGEALALSHDIADGLDDIALSPMVLLPITQAAFDGEGGALRTRYAIDAVEAGGGIDITLRLEGGTRPPAWNETGLDPARRTLEAYYADTARLEFGSEGSRHWARVSLAPAALPTAPLATVSG
jgi:hypothetical protein